MKPRIYHEETVRAVHTMALPNEVRSVAETWVKNRTTGEWIDLTSLASGWTLSLPPSLFNADVFHLTGLPNTATVLDARSETQRVDTTAYLPGQPRICVHNGQRVLNTWSLGGVDAVAGDWSLIDRTLRHLMPDDHREKFLDAVACLVKRPDANIAWGLIFRGQVGTGKTLIFEGVMSRLVGVGNYKRLEGDVIASKFTAELGDVQVLYLNEVVRPNDKQVANRLKSPTSEAFINAEAKGLSTSPKRSPSFIVVSSQAHRPFPLENPERRWDTPPFVGNPLDPMLGKALKDNMDAQCSAFLWYLREERDITQFDPGEPMWGGCYEPDEDEVEDQTTAKLNDALAEIATGMGTCELALLPDLMKMVEAALGWTPKAGQFSEFLTGAGWVCIGKLHKGRQGNPGIWARVDGETWKSVTYPALHSHLVAHGVIPK